MIRFRQAPGLGPGHWGLRGWAGGQPRALGAGPMAGHVPVTGFFLFAVANRFYAARGMIAARVPRSVPGLQKEGKNRLMMF